MPTFLLTPRAAERWGPAIREACTRAGVGFDCVTLPDDPEARLGSEEVARIEAAFFSPDCWELGLGRGFFAAVHPAPNLQWMHCANAGVDNPAFTRLMERGVRLTTSSGSTAKPIAQTVIGGMLMLARGFLTWGEQQRRHEWRRLDVEAVPDDLEGQRMVVYGMGAIGSEVARIADAIGLQVTGIRRSAWHADDPIRDVRPPSELRDLLPEIDWLVLASPLTQETRHLVDADVLRLLKPGARIINIARGEVIDEPALIEALRSGRLGGAYLDVTEQEPLPPESPLWDLPNVIISPHNSSLAKGNEARTVGFLLRNIERWAKGETMVNEVLSPES